MNCLRSAGRTHIASKARSLRAFLSLIAVSCAPTNDTIDTDTSNTMASYNAPFEIHVHGQIALKSGVSFDNIQDALRPIWKYAGARSLADAVGSFYEDEPGIQFDAKESLLQMCWTVEGDDDFRQELDEMCMNLNELAQSGAAIEVTFFDAEFDEQEEDPGTEQESRDDFVMLFVGPDPASIMQVQRDLLVQDVVNLMERHFDGAELGGVVAAIDQLFTQRFDSLVNSLQLGKPPRGSGGGSAGGHGSGRKPRHLH
jgi:alkylhydroperoxidase/carboxymuconolactone decarboxylase family protein YurZ